MGTSDLIPGVSGGTMALILGIYQELISSLGSLTSTAFLTALARLHVRRAFRLANGSFLLAVLLGIATAVAALSRVMHWLLTHHPSGVHALFFGLILASTGLVARRVGHWTVGGIVGAALAAVGAFWLVGLTPAVTPGAPAFLLFSGALAVCALMLPGISGAFVLVLLGKYDAALAAVTHVDLAVLAPLAIGAVVGLLTFARLLAWLLRRAHDVTLAILAGFMLGSLRKVWPFVTANGHVTWPWLSAGALSLVLLLVAGAVLVAWLERAGTGRET
jgi:putative membrane protein